MLQWYVSIMILNDICYDSIEIYYDTNDML